MKRTNIWLNLPMNHQSSISTVKLFQVLIAQRWTKLELLSVERNKTKCIKKEIEEMTYDLESNSKTKVKRKKEMNMRISLNSMTMKLKSLIESQKEMNQMSQISKQVVTMKLKKLVKMLIITKKTSLIRKTFIYTEVFFIFMVNNMIKLFKIWNNAQTLCIKTKFCILKTNFQIKISKLVMNHQQVKVTLMDKTMIMQVMTAVRLT